MLIPEPPAGLHPVCLSLAYRVAGTSVVAVPLIDRLYTIDDPVLANLVMLYHEAFHVYQGATFEPTGKGGWGVHREIRLPLETVRSAALGELAARERRLLDRALSAEDSIERLRLTRCYLRLRNRRLGLVPKDLRFAEAHLERKEGVAQLVALRAAAAAVGAGPGAVRTYVLSDLAGVPPFDGTEYMSNGYRQWHVYATGAAIALLLEAAGVAWEVPVAAGATPIELLREVVGRAPHSP
jgi:hypothetical protein